MEIWPMRQQAWTIAVVWLTVLGGPAGAAESSGGAGSKTLITNVIGMKLVLIPPGEFIMGSRESTEDVVAFFNKKYGQNLLKGDYFEDEHPEHRVLISRPFYLATCPVTRGQFRRFVGDKQYKTEAERGTNPGAYGWNPDTKAYEFNAKFSWRNVGFEQTDEHPVVNVSWNDAMAFCQWLSERDGNTYRLPSEAEWEYACRAGTTTRYYSGDDPELLPRVANVADATAKAKFPNLKYTIRAKDGYVFTCPVGLFKPNAFGLYDMHGNVWQWCSDWYDSMYYIGTPTVDPLGPDYGQYRVLRGGSWNNWPIRCRSAARGWFEPEDRNITAGIRVARMP